MAMWNFVYITPYREAAKRKVQQWVPPPVKHSSGSVKVWDCVAFQPVVLGIGQVPSDLDPPCNTIRKASDQLHTSQTYGMHGIKAYMDRQTQNLSWFGLPSSQGSFLEESLKYQILSFKLIRIIQTMFTHEKKKVAPCPIFLEKYKKINEAWLKTFSRHCTC